MNGYKPGATFPSTTFPSSNFPVSNPFTTSLSKSWTPMTATPSFVNPSTWSAPGSLYPTNPLNPFMNPFDPFNMANPFGR